MIYIVVLFILIFIFILNYILNYTYCSNCIHVSHSNMCETELSGSNKMFNPSIININDNYICCARISNLSLKNLYTYLCGKFNYKSYLCFFNIKNKKIIIEKPNIKNIDFGYEDPGYEDPGYEDPRAIVYDNKIIVSVTEVKNMQNFFPCLYIYDFNFKLLKRIEYNKLDYFGKNKVNNKQKNWCPFLHENKIMLHTDAYPVWRVFDLDIQNGNMNKIIEKNLSFFKENIHLRCSTSWKEFDNEHYVCALHTKTKLYPTIRTVFVLIDKKSLLPVMYTRKICFSNNLLCERIQYISGLENSINKNNLLLSFGINDYKIIIKKISKKELFKRFIRI